MIIALTAGRGDFNKVAAIYLSVTSLVRYRSVKTKFGIFNKDFSLFWCQSLEWNAIEFVLQFNNLHFQKEIEGFLAKSCIIAIGVLWLYID